MKRLVFIVEGETEESFVNNILCPYLYLRGFCNTIQCFKTKHSHGGISKYSYIKRDIINTIYETDVVVTTMIDFYRLPGSFPGYSRLKEFDSHIEQVAFLEAEMRKDIEESCGGKMKNFIPYIQLHEFEALIFSSEEGIELLFETSEYNRQKLYEVLREFSNPEDINNGANTAPSVRLKEIIQGYNKVVHGIDILKEIGMKTILSKCPRFREWIKKLESSLQ